MARWFRRAYPSGSFVCQGLTSPALLRFHFPLVEADVQFSRIRLPEVVTSTDRSDSFRLERACLPGGSHTR